MTHHSHAIWLHGDFAPDRLAASYERAFYQLGHSVVRCDTREAASTLSFWIRNRVGHRATISSLRARRFGSRAWNQCVIESARKSGADFALIFNGDFLMPDTLDEIRASGLKVYLFHADNPFPPNTANRPESLPLALAVDCYFIWSAQLRRRLLELGVRRVEYLPFAWDDAVVPHGEYPAQGSQHEVIFIGGWDHYREQFLERVACRFDLKIWGPEYWRSRTSPLGTVRRCWMGEELRGPKASAVMLASKIVLNPLRRQNLPDGTNMRTFEVPGCGAFVLSTRTQGAVDIFSESIAGAYFDSPRECCEKIERYLLDVNGRRDIAHRAHQLVEVEHQYRNRALQILDVHREICGS